MTTQLFSSPEGDNGSSLTPEQEADIDRLMDQSQINYKQAIHQVTGKWALDGEVDTPSKPSTFVSRNWPPKSHRLSSGRNLESIDRRPDLKPAVPRWDPAPVDPEAPLPPMPKQPPSPTELSYQAYQTLLLDGLSPEEMDIPEWFYNKHDPDQS